MNRTAIARNTVPQTIRTGLQSARRSRLQIAEGGLRPSVHSDTVCLHTHCWKTTNCEFAVDTLTVESRLGCLLQNRCSSLGGCTAATSYTITLRSDSIITWYLSRSISGGSHLDCCLYLDGSRPPSVRTIPRSDGYLYYLIY